MMPRFSPALALLLGAGAALLMSCRRPEVRVYLAPRDATPAPAAPTPPQAPARPKPKIAYTLPAGWQEAPPGDVSIAAFVAKGDGGEANINITPLPDLRGREALVVNMYRQQTGQPPIEQADLGKSLEPVEVAGAEGQMLELLGANHGKPTRMIAVMSHRDGRSWFYRISGDDAFVTTQKPTFLAFLKTVQIEEAPAAAEAPAGAPQPQP